MLEMNPTVRVKPEEAPEAAVPPEEPDEPQAATSSSEPAAAAAAKARRRGIRRTLFLKFDRINRILNMAG